MTITHGSLDLTVQSPHPPSWTWDLIGQGHGTSWPSLETSLNLFTSDTPPLPTGSDMWLLSKHVRSAEAGGTHPTGKISCLRILLERFLVIVLLNHNGQFHFYLTLNSKKANLRTIVIVRPVKGELTHSQGPFTSAESGSGNGKDDKKKAFK